MASYDVRVRSYGCIIQWVKLSYKVHHEVRLEIFYNGSNREKFWVGFFFL